MAVIGSSFTQPVEVKMDVSDTLMKDVSKVGSSEENVVLVFLRNPHPDAPWMPLDEHEKVTASQT